MIAGVPHAMASTALIPNPYLDGKRNRVEFGIELPHLVLGHEANELIPSCRNGLAGELFHLIEFVAATGDGEEGIRIALGDLGKGQDGGVEPFCPLRFAEKPDP